MLILTKLFLLFIVTSGRNIRHRFNITLVNKSSELLRQAGVTLACDWKTPCPKGTKCQIRSNIAPGRFFCYPLYEPNQERQFVQVPERPIALDRRVHSYDIEKGQTLSQRIKLLNDAQCPPLKKVSTCQSCMGVGDCQRGLVCCDNAVGKKSCTSPNGSTNSSTRLIQLIEGRSRTLNWDPVVTEKVGSVTLLQTQGLYFLIDTGTSSSETELLRALADQGVDPDFIYQTIVTHGHPDHYGGAHLFRSPMIFGRYRVNGDIFVENELASMGRNYLCTRNAFTMWTPGHSYDDSTLIVTGVGNLGTVAIAGDLFINEKDINSTAIWKEVSGDKYLQERNRRKILCMVNAIIPGHGPMFKVTENIKNRFQCSRPKS